MRVNGISASHQVVHHLDLIEVGRHKLHFFDDELLAKGVKSLESTVQTDYERTMLAMHAPPTARQPPPPPAEKGRGDDVDRTVDLTAPRRFRAIRRCGWGRRRKRCAPRRRRARASP